MALSRKSGLATDYLARRIAWVRILQLVGFPLIWTLVWAAASVADDASRSDRDLASPDASVERGRAMLVLDASGSMWGEIGDATKIEIARGVVSEVLESWDAEIALGLMAHGHREKGNCNDIETLEPGKFAAPRFAATVGRLRPKGKIPLTKAVQVAAESLKFTENRATVILVSDGEETCGLDPCEVGRSLEELGIDFTAHVISFDVPEDQVQGMRCLAERTGGRFLQAANANELREVFGRAVATATDQQALRGGPATLSAPDSVVAGSAFRVEWSGPQNRSDQFIIRSPQDRATVRNVYIGDRDRQSPTELIAPESPGRFELRYETRDGRVLAATSLNVVAAQASVDAVESAVTAGSKFEVAWTGPRNAYDRLGMVRAGGVELVAYDPEATPPPEGQHRVDGASACARGTWRVRSHLPHAGEEHPRTGSLSGGTGTLNRSTSRRCCAADRSA